ncbi:hypothetical protein GUJ93_ZPchr0006g43825 [Zizania palustris]|uniref:Uncharacterized protein n=1 Tax=Zizania palustris TaxID=103762 RepID=A0A8J5W1C6_ZIZPA|nr:hypothetical protein GUJ93_ZPchr0006g43825 [Zizania palustris]
MGGDKENLNLSNLNTSRLVVAATLSAEDRVGLINALKDKLQSLAGQHTDVLEALSPNVRKCVEYLREIQVEVKADEKVQTLLIEVLRHCDSILEALHGTRGSGGCVVLGVGGGINTVNMGGDVARDNIGVVNDGVGSAVLDIGTNVIQASDTSGSILTSTGVEERGAGEVEVGGREALEWGPRALVYSCWELEKRDGNLLYNDNKPSTINPISRFYVHYNIYVLNIL